MQSRHTPVINTNEIEGFRQNRRKSLFCPKCDFEESSQFLHTGSFLRGQYHSVIFLPICAMFLRENVLKKLSLLDGFFVKRLKMK